MPTAKEVDAKPAPTKPGKDLVTDEMKKQATANAKKVRKQSDSAGTGVMRRQGGPGSRRTLVLSEVPYPVDAHGENFEFYGPLGYGAVIPEGTDIAELSADQEFMIDPEKVKFMTFDAPGRNLPKKRLYVIKGVHRDGRIVQLPFEPQIQNNAGGDPEDAIGLRRYQRKGITVLIDWQTLVPVYCGAWDCWAQATSDTNFPGFCTMKHAKHTLPNQYKNAGQINQGLMDQGVTTTTVWSA